LDEHRFPEGATPELSPEILVWGIFQQHPRELLCTPRFENHYFSQFDSKEHQLEGKIPKNITQKWPSFLQEKLLHSSEKYRLSTLTRLKKKVGTPLSLSLSLGGW
jgi:hypothetical protein